MDEVHALRDRYGADLVVLLRTDHPDWCGVANLAVISSDADDDSAFAVVSVALGALSNGRSPMSWATSRARTTTRGMTPAVRSMRMVISHRRAAGGR